MEAVARHLAQLKRGYHEGGGADFPNELLRWQIAVALLMRAKISSLRALSPAWTRDIHESIVEAQRVLAGESPWLPEIATS